MKQFNRESKKPYANSNNRQTIGRKSIVEITAKQEVKNLFINWFKSVKAESGHIMTKQDVIKNVIKKLDKKLEKSLEEGMKDLVDNHWIEVQEDGVTLVLTEQGAKFIKQ